MVIFSQYIHFTRHHAVYFKIIQCYLLLTYQRSWEKLDMITRVSTNESMEAGNYVTSDMLLYQVQFAYHISTEYHKQLKIRKVV